jgi:hypothetical protein
MNGSIVRIDGRKFIFDGASLELGYLPLGENTQASSISTQSVIFKGISIEVLNFKYTLQVQDTFMNIVPGASVYITDLVDFLEQGYTDRKGYYYGNAEEGTTYVLTVTSEGFFTFIHRFRILPLAGLNYPTKNFPVLVRDGSDAPVSGASINITSPGHSDSGITNASGLYQGVIRADQENAITISKSGFTTYNHSINPYIKITSAVNDKVVVPVIVLT